jgi:hypothetical protein
MDPGNSIEKDVQIKMQKSMSFGQVVALLTAKYENKGDYLLRLELPREYGSSEWKMIFDSDTPASVCSFLAKKNSPTY